jgi:DnaJ-domain-containing protein 1
MATQTSFDELLNTKQKKLAFFQNLILVAIADNYLDQQESDFLVQIGRRLNLTEEDTAPIADNLSLLSFIIPEEGLQKTMELQTLVMMVLQDGRVDKAEYNLCLDYARRIGYSKDMLDEFIQSLSQS